VVEHASTLSSPGANGVPAPFGGALAMARRFQGSIRRSQLRASMRMKERREARFASRDGERESVSRRQAAMGTRKASS
jgi:hypothetical protein